MRLWCILFVLAFSPDGAAEWHAPPEADYGTIAEEAKEDTRTGRFEEALEKYEWLQSDALGPNPFPHSMDIEDAIHGWVRLGKRHPPAMESLTNTRNRLESKLTNGDDNAIKIFRYLAAVYSAQGDECMTAKAFASLDKNHPEIAESVFNRAYRCLVQEGEYEICAKYLSPKKTCERLVEVHKFILDRLSNDTTKRGTEKIQGNKSVTLEYTSSIIAILVISDRLQEAKEIAEYLREEMGPEWGKEIIDEALKGVLPPHYQLRSETK